MSVCVSLYVYTDSTLCPTLAPLKREDLRAGEREDLRGQGAGSASRESY